MNRTGSGSGNRWMAAMVAALVVLAITALTAMADGYRNPPQSAAALGRGTARYASGQDPAGQAFNPALLSDVDEATVAVGLIMPYTKTTYTSPGGAPTEDTESPWGLMPSAYAAYPLPDSRCTLGVAVYSPFGQATEWERDGLFVNRATYLAQMYTVNVAPSLSMRLSRTLAVGAGVDILWSELEFKQMFQLQSTLPPVQLTFEGDGAAVGATVGAVWKPAEGHVVALSYRSPMSVTYEGDFTVDAPLPPPLSSSSDFETELNFPTVVAAGYSLQLTDTLRTEVDIEWVEHSRNDELVLDIDNNNVLLQQAVGSNRLPQNWDDQWTLAVGGDWVVSPEWMLRCGYAYLPTPIPDSTLMPYLAQGDKHVVAAGAGYTCGRHTVDIAYSWIYMEERDVANSMPGAPYPADGSYETDLHVLGVSYAYTL